MPNNDQNFPLTADIVPGESIKNVMVQEAPKGPNPGVVEDTTSQQKNEEQVTQTSQSAETAVTEQPKKDDSETFVSGSAKARQLGESRRKLAEGLLKIAKGDPEKGIPARPDEVKQIIGEDPMLDKYFKKAWPKDYATLFGGITEEEYEDNLTAIEQKATAKVKAELLADQIKNERREEAYDLAQKLSFSQTEADSLVELAEQLEGAKVAGKELDREEALKRAAYVIRPEKAKVGITSLGSVTGSTPTNQEKSSISDDALLYYAKRTGRKLEDVRENLKLVEANLKGNIFEFPM